jgi:hypothetical protein
MEASTQGRKESLGTTSLIRAVYDKRTAESAFLRKRCDSGFLTPVQQATILGLIDRLMEEEKILEWVMGLMKTAPHASISAQVH